MTRYSLMNSATCLLALCLGVAANTAAETADTPIPIEWSGYQVEFDTNKDLDIQLDAGNPLFIVEPGKESDLTLAFNNVTDRPIPIDLSVSVKDASYLPADFAAPVRITVPANGQFRYIIPKAQLGDLGIKYLEYVADLSGQKREGLHTFAYMEPVGATKEIVGRKTMKESFIFGLGGGSNSFDNQYDLGLRACALIGVESIRKGIDWHEIQKSEDSFDWSEPDRMVEGAARYGMQIQGLLAFCPGWAVDPTYTKPKAEGWFLSAPPRLDAWSRFAYAVGKRYKGKGIFYEVWNEPDLTFWRGSDEQYLEMLKAGYRQLKRADPDATVMTGGFGDSEHAHRNNPELFDKMLRNYSDYFDIVAYHRHSNFLTFRPELDNYILPRFERYGINQPLVFNETSMARPFETEHEVGEELFKRLTYAWSRGARGYWMFALNDVGSSPDLPISRYGILNDDMSPRPAYVHYNTIIRYLRGKRYIEALPLQGDHHALLFGNDDQWTLAGWKTDIGTADQLLALSVDPSAQAFDVDLNGNRTPVENDNGTVLFQTRAAPHFLVIEGSVSQPAFDAPFLAVAKPVRASPGLDTTIPVELTSPYGGTREVVLNLEDPQQLATPGSLKNQPVKLIGGQTRTVDLPLAVAPSFRRSGDVEPAMAVHYQIKGTGLSGSLDLPIVLASVIPPTSASGWDRPADFVLNQYDDVVNLYENLPQTDHLNWKGPDDLSAKVWLGREDGNLLIRIVATDDVHRVVAEKGKLWQGDSLQIGVAEPGQTAFTELNLAHFAPDRNMIHTSRVPHGQPDPAERVLFTSSATKGQVTYDLMIPYKVLGLTDEMLERGIKFNVLINDNDEGQREGWVRVAPGIGKTKTAATFPVVVFE